MEEKIVYKEKPKIRFENLSPALKTIIVLDWIIAGIYALSFIVGVVIGLTE